MSEASTALLPCPFCGAEPAIGMALGGDYVVDCPHCGDAIEKTGSTQENAIANWNNRPSERALETHIGRLKSALAAAILSRHTLHNPGRHQSYECNICHAKAVRITEVPHSHTCPMEGYIKSYNNEGYPNEQGS